MCPPFALVTVLILLVIDFMRTFRRRLSCREREVFGGRSIMVWGGISHGLKSQLVVIDGNLTAARNRYEILRPHVIPFLQQHNLTLQQDNATHHIARICQVFLANNNVQPLDWPPYSPDLSPTEHLWDQLDR